MSNAVNKVILVGYLGGDTVLRYTSLGAKYARFRLATNESWVKEGQRHEHTEWHSVTAWNRIAEIAGEYLSTGSKIYLEGKLRSRSWDGDDGITRYSTEIRADRLVMLDPPPPRAFPDEELEDSYDEYPF
jgi:single-strand DNA-binding protein